MKKLLLILVVCIFIFGPRFYKSYLDNEIENTMEGWVMDYNPITKQMELHPPEYFDSINRVYVNSFPKYEKTYYDNGNLKEEGNLLNRFTKDGIWKHYYSSGELNWTTTYKNGKTEGTSLSYYKSGKLKSKTMYINDKTEGEVKSYYETGELKSIYNHKNNKRIGLGKLYYKNGKLLSEWDFKDGSNGYTPFSKKCWDQDGNEIECHWKLWE